jgi:hypothetical protein
MQWRPADLREHFQRRTSVNTFTVGSGSGRGRGGEGAGPNQPPVATPKQQPVLHARTSSGAICREGIKEVTR